MTTRKTIQTIFIVIGFTVVTAASAVAENTETLDKHEVHSGETTHSTNNSGAMKHGEMSRDKNPNVEHNHPPVDASGWPAAPAITMTAFKDLESGWNLHIMPSNFTFAPTRVNMASASGEGHAHLYINGEKVTRLYSEWYYIDQLPPGMHTVTVTLNANDHGPLTLNGEPVTASLEIVQE